MNAAEQLKPCAGICGGAYPLSAFTRNAAKPDGRSIYCRECEPLRSVFALRLLDDEPEPVKPDETRAMTLKEVGEELGLSPQRVQAIEAAALRKLRRNVRAMAVIRRLLEP